jgi:putative hemolysin
MGAADHSCTQRSETAMRDLPQPTFPFSNLGGAAAYRPASPQAHALNASNSGDRTRFDAVWARSEDDVRQAQQLRHLVFAQEMGARLTVPKGTPPGLDVDLFDPFCEHLLVRASGARGEPGPVIGTYRVLTPAAAKRVGGWYSETEFDLTRLAPLKKNMVELGRSCVHPAWRSGGAILALWGALAEFMLRNSLDTIIGCASVSMRDGGHFAASLWQQLNHTHPAPMEWCVTPRMPLPMEGLRTDLHVEPPALVKGYLRCGAKLLGAPAWDPDFNTADLPLLLRVEDLPERYRRHFMGEAAQGRGTPATPAY